MKEILTDIFYENEFELTNETDQFKFFQKENQEYFFIAEYKEEELENFFISEKTDEIINTQSDLNKRSEDVNKNTSLVIYVKTKNLEEFIKNNKKNVYKIEEDEYYFRKYVIVYTDESIKEIKNSKVSWYKINDILLDFERINQFEKEYYKDEEFYFVVQLYIKLPFLIYEIEDKSYVSIQKKILDNLIEKRLFSKYQLVNSWIDDTISNMSEREEKDYLESLQDSFLEAQTDDELLINFLERLEMKTNED